MRRPLLEVLGIYKSFPGVRALQDVRLSLGHGEVLALIGENGAGKSTLMKILAGVHRPDAGVLLLDGAPVTLPSPRAALDLGIALIHQELNLCDNLSVAGSLFLGRELRSGPFLQRRAMEHAARAVLLRVGLDVDPRRLVDTLAPAQKQLLEISRALLGKARILIMDEPTSSLTQIEAERLFAVVGELTAAGVGVIYISHRLNEVTAIADRVVVLRDGRNAGEINGVDATNDRMVSMMVGRSLSGVRRVPHEPGEEVLSVQGLRTAAWPAAQCDLSLRTGEVVGIAGLLGAGRTELLRALVGADRVLSGSITCGGVLLSGHGPAVAAAAGLVLVPEDRKQQGLILSMNVRENLSLPTLRSRGVLVDREYERELTESKIRDLAIATPHGEQRAGALSGGNQQKIVIGKWLAAAPKVLLLDEPTRGVDVGARAEIYARLHDLAATGLAVLFVSSELVEVLTLADRVLVMHEGRIQGTLGFAEMTEQTIMTLATGTGAA
ncbi:MAG: sugar ABC transporter ATP-binding protein [Planctomycetota bacterium]|nr:sugar ABC transporter ATP-binding protein [Planctomycetota bacterium]MSR38057.1 sugar ABC transporter ATP-binding protein [Planctomycetota bacterium]